MPVDPATLSLFALAVLLLLLSPGPNMAFVIAHGIAYGWRGGLAASLGIGAADLVLTALTALGVAALVAQWPPAFDLIRGAGALYLLWLAWQAWRHPGRLTAQAARDGRRASLLAVSLRSMLNSLLNPKALLFFLVFLPQFADAGRGGIARQLLLLGGVLTLISVAFHAALGGIGAAVHRLLAGHARAARWQSRGLALLLVLLALRLLWSR
ncbi:LysE family translocator [Roseateles sp. DAIF2]|nr:LysE family translocator [Roseateles sp. DAIF2]